MAGAGTHDATLVLLSIAIAVFASYSALDLAGRMRAAHGWARAAWLCTAALAMGGGIWAMHFVAMLAFSMPGMEVHYSLGLTLLSVVVAIGSTGVAFALVSGRDVVWRQLLPAGLLMGLGVVGMHYIGMAAMQMPATISYDRWWLSISIFIAIGAATVALWLAGRNANRLLRAGAASAMGAAIAGMHFAGMRAARFTALDSAMAPDRASLGQTALALAVAGAAFVILLLSLVAANVDRRLAAAALREADALRESEERFRALYLRTPLPLFSLDRDGRLEQVSNNWLDLFGFTRDEVIGRPLRDFLAPDSALEFTTRDWPLLVARDVLEECDYRAMTKNGDVRDVIVSARVERDSRGGFRHVLGGLTDVTARHEAEKALQQAQKSELLGHLTGGVAHDFNNLLAVIIGNLDLLRTRPLDAKAERFLNGATQGAQRGAALTQRLLAFARKQDLRPRAVDVAELVAGMDDLLRRSLGPSMNISTDFPDIMPPAHVDAHQLELALLNLAVNARDAMPDGGDLRIEGATEHLAPENRADLPAGSYVRLTMIDRGHGMDAATLARATDPFFTTKPAGKGTGLGLSMVHGLAAQSGGRLLIRSQPGAGTSIDLLLPATVRSRAAGTSGPKSIGDRLPAQPRRVLLVEDDPLVRQNIAAMLDEIGHHVTIACSGEEALEQLARDQLIDMVVTDQLMPGMLGTQLIRRIHHGAPTMPVLIVSGYAEFTAAEAAIYPVLGKPFTRAELAQAVDQVMERSPLGIAASA
ncbi:MHYT domain-containing protein [uncultured Sphingomonas sp.]|uniref:MHYT domain-containing protein n=1 Tax=uncultured Sphingomonas sp. TaxID=158754 RepID=UPI002621C823|nr:MHYT domain-containing protein [uncultured Sphingomonas sp.]